MNDINKILNLLHPLLKRYYYNQCQDYPKEVPKIEAVEDLMWIVSDQDYIKMEIDADQKATEHIKKLFPDFKKIEVDG